MLQNVANLCVRCESRFRKWADYHQHISANTCSAIIRPINTSGRTKTQIVTSWENLNKGIFIE